MSDDTTFQQRDLITGIAVEGAADFSFGRPLDANPYVRENAEAGWESWRYGWLGASRFNEWRGDEERKRWRTEAA